MTLKNEHGLLKFPGGFSGDGGDGMSLEQRVGKLEEHIMQIKEDVSNIKGQLLHFSTKSDVSDAKSDIIKWMVGTMLASAALATTIVFGLLHQTNNPNLSSQTQISAPASSSHKPSQD